MVEALHAVQLVGGVLLDPHAARQLVVASWYAAEPAARAAAFADAADVLTELADQVGDIEELRAGIQLGSLMLDQMSCQIVHEMRSPQ